MTVLTVRHPILDSLSDDLLSSGKWQGWCESDTRLAAHPSLTDALEAWRRDRCESAYLTVAALASMGSSRGGNDDDAALAVVVLLQDGIVRLAADLRDQCELDDVLAAVWEEVKRSAPNLGHRAPRFLLQRAKARLLAPAHGFVDRNELVSLDNIGAAQVLESSRFVDPRLTPGRSTSPNQSNMRSLLALVAPAEDACEDLRDLLEWARGTGVLEQADVDLVLELMAASRSSAGREDAYRALGERHGVAMRTIRRRRDAVVRRLREAACDYLAEVS
jgi:hypothetical protein